LDKLLKQTKKFLLYKIIPRAGFNLATGRFWPEGRMFDTPELGPRNYFSSMIFVYTCICSKKNSLLVVEALFFSF